jgi:spore germination protein GerM
MIKQIFYTILVILIGIALGIIVGVLVYFLYPEAEEPVETMTIRVFFSNHYEDPNALHCDKVYFAEREVEKSQTLAYVAIEEMLKGPNQTEQEGGFLTNINEDVKIQSFDINDGIARVDFDEKLDEGVAGSCLVQAIRAQITETLKQFSEIEEVIISIDGRTENILQP